MTGQWNTMQSMYTPWRYLRTDLDTGTQTWLQNSRSGTMADITALRADYMSRIAADPELSGTLTAELNAKTYLRLYQELQGMKNYVDTGMWGDFNSFANGALDIWSNRTSWNTGDWETMPTNYDTTQYTAGTNRTVNLISNKLTNLIASASYDTKVNLLNTIIARIDARVAAYPTDTASNTLRIALKAKLQDMILMYTMDAETSATANVGMTTGL